MQYKIACDGNDLVGKFDGNILNESTESYAKQFTIVDIPENIEQFVLDTVTYRKQLGINPRELSNELCDKYEVGLFCAKDFVDKMPKSHYVLFNERVIEFWKAKAVVLDTVLFMTCVSRDATGQINGMGFRVLDQDQVLRAFKWLFPFGQACTFGLHLCDANAEIVACEGFLDMIAFQECGYNAVGLGSAVVTEEHAERLGDNWIFCGDFDKFGVENRQKTNNSVYYDPIGKDPYEVWKEHGYINLIKT